MAERFPLRAADGSFCVQAVFHVSTDIDKGAVQEYLNRWVEANGQWNAFGEVHNFDDYFAAEPKVDDVNTEELTLVFRGSPSAPRFWKDWFARILGDLSDAFPNIGELKHVDNG